MATQLMIAEYNYFMQSLNRVSYFAAKNGQIIFTVFSLGGNRVRVSVEVFGETQQYSWQELPEAVTNISLGLDGRFFSNKELAEKALTEAAGIAGIELIKGIDAWALRYMQFSVISVKWRQLKNLVPRGSMSLREYRIELLEEWKRASWQADEKKSAHVLYDCAKHMLG